MTKKPKSISRNELRLIVQRHGGVVRFASRAPVEPRTVWYWLVGRKLRPVFAARVRAMADEIGSQKERGELNDNLRTPEQAMAAVADAQEPVVQEGGIIHEDAVWDASDMAMDCATIRALADRIKQERAEKYEPTSGWRTRGL